MKKGLGAVDGRAMEFYSALGPFVRISVLGNWVENQLDSKNNDSLRTRIFEEFNNIKRHTVF